MRTTPATSPTALNKALRRFRRDRRGSAAVEFAFVAPLFFAMLFAIMETGLMFFAAQVLETGTQDSARLMLTNQAQNQKMSQSEFETNLCNRVKLMFNCGGSSGSPGITVVVKSYAAGASIPSADLVDPITGGVFTGQPAYATPEPGSTVLIRTFYQWPLFVTQLGYNLANLFGPNGTNRQRLLAATAVFRVEPNGS
jgi:Flp pilus assembly protein TadG